MKQSSSAIEKLATTFFLSQGERHLLLTAEVGEALFFAGQNHVAMKVVASPEEHTLITTNPQETLDRQKAFADKLLSTKTNSPKAEPLGAPLDTAELPPVVPTPPVERISVAPPEPAVPAAPTPIFQQPPTTPT
jgi:hypothetical protein